jgi:hypothetical protein
MIVFITSLRHPWNANSYSGVLALLEQTLRSVCRQTSDQFRVLVVCNEPPAASPHPAVSFLTVHFPPPSPRRQASTGMEPLRLDRGCKYLMGLLHVRAWAPDHVMFFDADDFVSNRLAALSAADPTAPGWYVHDGYVYDTELGRLGTLQGFNRICGTGHIVRHALFDLPEDLPEDASQPLILERVDREYLMTILGSHRWIAGHLASRGTPLAPLPFPGAVYHVGHGENHTSRLVSHALWTGGAEGLSRIAVAHLHAIRDEFTLPGFPAPLA